MTDYKNATLPINRRVALMMPEMNLEEKVGQLGQHIPGWTAYENEGTHIERVSAGERREIRSRGANIGYGPVLDLTRDPRWSRCEEIFGEDPCLTARMGEAMVRGLQGRELAQLSGHDKVVSIPRNAANLPVYYNKKKMAMRGYVFNDGSPRYPFGFGLSYSNFAYGELRLSATAIRPGGNCVASVEVTNTGTRDGDEVVQLYLCDIFCSRTRPEEELKAFRRVRIAAGATQTVSFEINEALLAYHTADMSYAAEPGTFRILVGPDSQRSQEAQLELK